MRNHMMLWAGLVATGCGDYVGATGELGMMSYGLSTDYEIDGGLTDVSLITGHSQRFNVSLTDDGESDARKPWLITHTVTPNDGTSLVVDDSAEGDEHVPDFSLMVTNPDLYILESYYDGELLDYIKLDFAQPDTLEILTWIRNPNADAFTASTFDASVPVEEGTQVALLPIPYFEGERLAGDFTVSYDHTPAHAAVTVHNVTGVYEEEGVMGQVNSSSLVFIEPATVEVSVTDAANGVTAVRTFDVSAASSR